MVTNHNLSEVKNRLLERYLQQGRLAGQGAEGSIAPRPWHQSIPLSVSQEQLWRRETSVPDIPPLYNECVTIRMKGPLDIGALEMSLREIIRRHEIWRTTYEVHNGGARQVVHAAPEEIQLPVLDLRNQPEAEALREAESLVRDRFDLQAGPLLRFKLLRTGDFDHRLLLCAHLSIVDGVSVYQVFPKELAALYEASTSGRELPFPPLPVQFGDYACWQRLFSQEKARVNQLHYWKAQLSGSLPVLDWPTGRARRHSRPFVGAIRQFTFSESARDAIAQLTRKEGVTPFTCLTTAFAVLLHHYTGQENILIGTPSPSGRKNSQVQKLLGYFLNPVVLRFDLSDHPALGRLLRSTQALILDALSNDDVPLETVAAEIQPTGDSSSYPFFRVAISLQPLAPPGNLDWTVTSMDVGSGGAPWDFYIAFINQPAGLIGRVQYNPDLFEEEAIDRVLEDFQALLEFMSANPLTPLSRMHLHSSQRQAVARLLPT